MALFIFGAGATRGCSFVNTEKNPCQPFLDNDFFTQLQRVRSTKHQKLIQDVIKDVVQLFGLNFDVTMESVFSTLEQMIAMLRLKGHGPRDLKVEDLEKIQGRLKQAIAVVLEESLANSEGQTHQEPNECGYHEKYVSKILRKKDTIISFNYDCVLDYALKKYGSDKWNPKYGYGFRLLPTASNLKGYEHWQPIDMEAIQGNTVQLFKLHGSLHFYIPKPEIAKDNPKVTLKKRPYTKQKGNLNFTIIPPEWHKKYNSGVFSNLWRKAGDAIANTKEIIIIGYSFPASDLHSASLFRTSLKKGSLKSLVVVNPDNEARKRSRIIMQRGISDETRVVSVDRFADFVAINRDVWNLAEATIDDPEK